MCRELRNKPGLEAVLKKSHSSALEAYTSTEDENDFREVLDPPQILRKGFNFNKRLPVTDSKICLKATLSKKLWNRN